MRNEMELLFDAVSDNESLARVAVAAFVAGRNPTLEELADIKTAVSEAVTNAIIHGYGNEGSRKKVKVYCLLEEEEFTTEITDWGRGIANVQEAMEPLFTTSPELERSGMGFSFMEAFMDELTVESTPGMGTMVRMKKRLGMADVSEQEV